jgi:hypothetical protein
MTVHEASFSGTLRTITVLVIAWWVLRMILRYQRSRTMKGGGAGHTPGPVRPVGDVRIERPPEAERPGPVPGGTIIDADFEEIK